MNRVKVTLIIVFINLIIIFVAVFASTSFLQSRINEAQETDLMLIADIADHYLSSEIEALKLKLNMVANSISVHNSNLTENLAVFGERFPMFTGFAVLGSDSAVIAAAGEQPATSTAVDDPFVRQAFAGGQTLSSTVFVDDSSGVVFYLSAALPSYPGNILVITLPGTYFSDLLSSLVVWNSGHINVNDSEGYIIANMRPEWVHSRRNFIILAEDDDEFADVASVVSRLIRGEAGAGQFSMAGVPRLSIFRPISGSESGWGLQVIAPIHESPFRNAVYGLVAGGVISLLFGLAAAIIGSYYIKKTYTEANALKEAAVENSKFKSQFIAGMSHEIRTPMNVIMGVTEILMFEEETSAEVKSGLDKIHASGDMLLGIINDILDSSKIEAGKLELITAKYDTASIINDTVAFNMMRNSSKPIDFKLSVDENLPTTLVGDELRIKQILNNILSNAFKYTDEGEVKLDFNVEKSGDDAFILEFTVSDTGIGMTEDEIKALYDRYARFNYQANRNTEGTGLGMPITQNLVALMHGNIHVESEIGKGSVFTVRLPQGFVDDNVIGRDVAEMLENFHLAGIWQNKKAQITYEPMPYGNVLVVDDAESNLFVTKGLLAPYQLKVETAISGFQAIDKIKSGKKYDIIFMDHMMPKMDGMETVKHIRDMGYSLPIVALTANAVSGQAERFLSNGFDDFISKPIDVRHLNTVLKEFIHENGQR